jgi:multidrug resistance efflux pump
MGRGVTISWSVSSGDANLDCECSSCSPVVSLLCCLADCSANSARAAELAQNAFAQDERDTALASSEAAVAAARQDLEAREAALQEGQQQLAAAQSEFSAAKLVNDQREAALGDKEKRLQAKVGGLGSCGLDLGTWGVCPAQGAQQG